jgi:peptidoglycan/LPS O-acetylase OafA/YrhL
MVSTAFALISIFGGFTNHAKDARRMEIAEYAIFFSMSRLTWALSISWIIFACHYGYGGPINSFLSIKSFIPLTRLSYCAYLIHPPIMQFFNYSQQALFHASGLTLVYIAIGHIFLTFFIAFGFTLFFEIPFVAVEKLIYPGRH